MQKKFIFELPMIYPKTKHMKKIMFILVIVVSIAKSKAQEKVNWLTFEEAIALNKNTPKPILIDVYTDWCGWCKKMDSDTYSNKIIAKIINDNFYAVKLDGEGKKDIIYKKQTFTFQENGKKGYHELAGALLNGNLSYPATVFMNKEEELIQNVPGYHQKEEFEILLTFFTNENYKTYKWKDFENNFKSNF
jgi:thioredoxin-related protein